MTIRWSFLIDWSNMVIKYSENHPSDCCVLQSNISEGSAILIIGIPASGVNNRREFKLERVRDELREMEICLYTCRTVGLSYTLNLKFYLSVLLPLYQEKNSHAA